MADWEARERAEEEGPSPQGETTSPAAEEHSPAEAAEEAPKTEKQEDQVSPVFDWVSAIVTAVMAVVLVFTFFVQLISVDGASMQPTLYHGDRLLVLNRTFCDFEAGDVVIVQQYNAPLDERIVKRIIATGGQTVDIDFDAGVLYVDGQALEEPYTGEPTYTPEGVEFPLTLGEDEVFVMGDNRNHSTDSRSSMLGPLDERYILGKAFLLVFPGRTASYLGEKDGTGPRDFSRIGLID